MLGHLRTWKSVFHNVAPLVSLLLRARICRKMSNHPEFTIQKIRILFILTTVAWDSRTRRPRVPRMSR